MKFLCDRCKTRYSIGDDRVRGKILKIRCKNCANVITVREGMTDVDASEPEGSPRRQRQTTMAPNPTASASASEPGALGAAFGSAMAGPPSALEEEWYVSNDGDQEGPYSLAEAQRWVATKPFDAELHCWSEGFDDWLPVDKVSHFRGVRKKPQAPPPLPRMGTGPARVIATPAREEEPKPLFAATMASLEKSAPAASNSGLGLAPSAAAAINGSAMRSGATPKPKAAVAPVAAKSMPLRSPTTPGAGVVSNGAAFDLESATQIEPTPFDDEGLTVGEPVAAAARRIVDQGAASVAAAPAAPAAPVAPAERTGNDAFVRALGGPHDAPTVLRPPIGTDLARATAPAVDEIDDEGDLQIGEVSRVVNLADLAKRSPDRIVPANRRSGPIATGPLAQRATGAMPNMAAGINPNGLAAYGGDAQSPGAPGQAPMLGDPNQELVAPPHVEVSHRRGMIALITVAALVLGAALVVLIVMGSNDDQFDAGLRGGGTIDTTRPDDIQHRSGTDPVEGPTNPFTGKPIAPIRPRNPGTNVTQHKDPKDPNDVKQPDGMALRPDEIEAEAAKRSTSTQRCYMRSQKGAEAILIGDVKKIAVTLTVDKIGNVTDVALSDHGGDSLGKCLMSAIRAWKFRESSAGITAKITMVFQSG